MSTSGSTDFSQTRNQIIADVLTLLGVYRPGATIATVDYDFCSNMLNKMIKGWEGRGIHLWTESEGTLFLTDSKNIYTLSASGDRAGKNAVQTLLTADGSSTSLTVSNTTGMTAADQIGIELDDNTIQWTTIVSVDSSTTLTITTSLTGTASSGNVIHTYTTATGRPLYIKSARLRNDSLVDRPIKVMSRSEFMNIPNKTSEGDVNAIYYTPQLDRGLLYTWLTPNNVGESINFTYVRSIEDFDSSSDTPDLPQEWLNVITTNLAVLVASAYGKNLRITNQELLQEASTSLIQAQLFDVEEGSFQIVPEYRDD